MQQLTQKLKSGEMKVLEVPVPMLAAGQVLVKNHYSLISAGTEGSTVKTARKGLIGKAKERPQQVKQVIDTLKSQGPVQTYRAVMKKLDAHSSLGYSAAGEVVDVGRGVSEFAVGDLVACGGLSACHAEVVAVPQNLCVKLSDKADLEQAAYNTLGAIAMQGVRQADLRLGESCAVIGLGLLGQLTGLLLKASGVRVIGIDINESMVSLAGDHAVDLALLRNDAGIDGRINDFTGGLGCDAVIITAASSSLDPVNFAGAVVRKRGSVVIVGAVPTGFDRDPHYYKKELQLKMSCSYGPGRYDPGYEEKGIDYPTAYVRWTEKRNMLAFQQLLATGRIDLNYLTTHRFSLDKAVEAYDMLMERNEPYIGILLTYDVSKKVDRSAVKTASIQSVPVDGRIGIGFIGAGSYAQSHLLPNIPSQDGVAKVGVMTATGNGARSVADRFGFEYCSGNEDDILTDRNVNTLLIATRHDSHARLVLSALQAGKHVFVEKPLCLDRQELGAIIDHFRQSSPVQQSLMVGYNRRFAPLAEKLKQSVGCGPMILNYRINAGAIPSDSWIQDPDVGGGRIIGEVCHFIDFLSYVTESSPVSVYAAALPDPADHRDSLQVLMNYADGSVATVIYVANGHKRLAKERVEVHAHGVSAVLDDFKKLTIYGKEKKEHKLLNQDKGQKNEVHEFISSLVSSGASPITLSDIIATSLATLNAVESLKTGLPVEQDNENFLAN